MTTPDRSLERIVKTSDRTFTIRTLQFDNGYFVSISEGIDQLGSLVVSLAAGPTPVTTSVIPSRSDSIFLRLVSERLSTQVRGIALVSLYTQKELDPGIAQNLMSEIVEMIQS